MQNSDLPQPLTGKNSGTENMGTGPIAPPDSDATQRVFFDHGQVVSQRPASEKNTSGNPRPANGGQPRRRPEGAAPQPRPAGSPRRRRPAMKKKDKITLIVLASVVVIMIAAIIGTVFFLFSEPKDDGKILNNVMAAGVNLGGLTPEQAKIALTEATGDTYTKLDMVISVLDTQVTLSPRDTGAKLNVDGVVQDAYNYGRVGSAAERKKAKNHALANSYIVPILPYLNLNTKYIESVVADLGSKFSSTLSQPSVTISGSRPEMGVPKPDTTVTHQTMEIFVGTPEYGLNTKQLYNQILDYYNINIFQVVANCTVVAPDSLDEELLEIYKNNCVAPVDAQINQDTFEVTPEVYGYGFNMEEVRELISTAEPGATLKIPLHYIEPNLTEDLLSGDLFKDNLGSFSSAHGVDTAWINNVTLAAGKLNGMILKAGDVFSFNEFFGELKQSDGYLPSVVYIGAKPTEVIGGGVTQIASVLYNCVMKADLEVLERHSHVYAPSFIEKGLDAYAQYGKSDFRFRNNGTNPIRIDAKVTDGMVQISITGTSNKDYVVEVVYEVIKTYKPGQLVNNMAINNPGGYLQDQVLVTPITGYDVNVYRCKYDKATGQLLSKDLEAMTHYASRDSVVVNLVKPEEPPLPPIGPTDPSDPVNPTDPSDPSIPTEPSEPSEPTSPVAPTDSQKVN